METNGKKYNNAICCISPTSFLKVTTLISIGLSVIVAYMSISIIYSSVTNYSEIEIRKTRIENKYQDLEEETRPSLSEINVDLLNDLTRHRLHSKHVSKILLLSGSLALAAGCFQFLSSLFLYFNCHDENQDSVQFWSSVSCFVFFCLVTCLILLLCLDTAQVPYYAQEIIFIIFVTIDLIFSIYSIWLIISTV